MGVPRVPEHRIETRRPETRVPARPSEISRTGRLALTLSPSVLASLAGLPLAAADLRTSTLIIIGTALVAASTTASWLIDRAFTRRATLPSIPVPSIATPEKDAIERLAHDRGRLQSFSISRQPARSFSEDDIRFTSGYFGITNEGVEARNIYSGEPLGIIAKRAPSAQGFNLTGLPHGAYLLLIANDTGESLIYRTTYDNHHRHNLEVYQNGGHRFGLELEENENCQVAVDHEATLIDGSPPSRRR